MVTTQNVPHTVPSQTYGAHAVVAPQAPEPSHVAGVATPPLHEAVAPQPVVACGYTHAPVKAAQAVAPQIGSAVAHAVAQQTPVAQAPEAHWSPAEHAVPPGALHAPARQAFPAAQSASVAQLVAQAVGPQP